MYGREQDCDIVSPCIPPQSHCSHRCASCPCEQQALRLGLGGGWWSLKGGGRLGRERKGKREGQKKNKGEREERKMCVLDG